MKDLVVEHVMSLMCMALVYGICFKFIGAHSAPHAAASAYFGRDVGRIIADWALENK